MLIRDVLSIIDRYVCKYRFHRNWKNICDRITPELNWGYWRAFESNCRRVANDRYIDRRVRGKNSNSIFRIFIDQRIKVGYLQNNYFTNRLDNRSSIV